MRCPLMADGRREARMGPDIRVSRVYDDPALTGTRDVGHSQAAVLAQILRHSAGSQAPPGQEASAGNPQPVASEQQRSPDRLGNPAKVARRPAGHTSSARSAEL